MLCFLSQVNLQNTVEIFFTSFKGSEQWNLILCTRNKLVVSNTAWNFIWAISSRHEALLSRNQIHSLPPVTKKYDRRTKAKTTIADGGFSHPGFLNFRLGTSKMWKGIPYKASILNTRRKGTLRDIIVNLIGPALRYSIQSKLWFYRGSRRVSAATWGRIQSCDMIGQWIQRRYFQIQISRRLPSWPLAWDASFRFVDHF